MPNRSQPNSRRRYASAQMTNASQTLGFIGLGAMGYAMAKNLREKSRAQKIVVFDLNPTAAERFQDETRDFGLVTIAQSAFEVVENCDVIITIVPEGKHVAAVYSSGPGGALAGNIKGKTFIECSTIDIQTSTRISDDVQQRGGAFVDCPVSGGTSGAEAGTITFMVGAEREDPLFDTITPILHTMGTNIISCGGPTLGLATKLCNNYISGTIAIATAEGMNLAVRLGLDPKVFSQALSVSTGGSWVNSHCNPVPGVVAKAPASHDYAPGFKTELMRKDYNLAVDAAHSVGARLVLGPVGLQTFTNMSLDPRCSGKDCRVVYRYLGGRE